MTNTNYVAVCICKWTDDKFTAICEVNPRCTIHGTKPDVTVTTTTSHKKYSEYSARDIAALRAEVSRTKRALKDSGIGGIFDTFTDPADAITQMALRIKELEPLQEAQLTPKEANDIRNALLKWLDQNPYRIAIGDKLRSLAASPESK